MASCNATARSNRVTRRWPSINVPAEEDKRLLQLLIWQLKQIHQLGEIAVIKPEAEPASALRRSPVGERVGDDIPLRLLLQAVIADGVGGRKRFFQVARLQYVLHLLRVMRPDPGQKIGLQFA